MITFTSHLLSDIFPHLVDSAPVLSFPPLTTCSNDFLTTSQCPHRTFPPFSCPSDWYTGAILQSTAGVLVPGSDSYSWIVGV